MVNVFALLALLCFVLALFGAHIGLDLVILGFCFIAAHLLFNVAIPWPGRR